MKTKKKKKSKQSPAWVAVYRAPVESRKSKRTATLVCSVCGSREAVAKWSIAANTRVRCSQCGGPLNKPSQA